MESVPVAVQLKSIKSFQSTIRKSEKALAQMKGKGASTSLIEKRLQAFYIGLATLETLWHEKLNSYSKEEMAEARDVLAGLLPSIKSMHTKAKPGSSQWTLLERRVTSIELAIEAIDDFLKD